MRGKRYRIGIDVGLNSVGLAAVEVSDENSPVRLLNAQSVIHDVVWILRRIRKRLRERICRVSLVARGV